MARRLFPRFLGVSSLFPAWIGLGLLWVLSLPAHADVWAYIDEKGTAHFAAEPIDARYQLFFRGKPPSGDNGATGTPRAVTVPTAQPKLIERGHVYIAKPPLFRVDAPARGKKPAAKIYALDQGELDATLDRLRKEGAREGSWSISRFKGLGEMSAEQLWETTLNPETRRLLPVAYGELDFAATVVSMTKLMGKGEAAARRELMELHGDAVEIDV